MRSVPYLAYVVCGLALGVVLYLCWRANARGGVDSEQEESFVSPIQLDPPTAPCNVDFGSLVQDQFLAENANQGSNKCQHQYPDPTVFGGEIRMQQSPNRFVFCTSKAASQLDKCPAECTGGGCISLQSEADNITNATRKKTNQFIKSLNKFEHLQFGPMRNLFEGVSLPPASEYAEEEGEQTEGLTLIPGVYPTLKVELARREALISEMDSLQTDIQTATDAVNKLKKHVDQQSLCEMTHPSALNPIPGMKSHYYKDSGVANPHQEPPTKDHSRYAGVAHGYSCFTGTPDSKKYAKWLNYNDIDGKTCAKVLKLKPAGGLISHGLIDDDIRTKCEANQKCREQIKSIHPKSSDVNKQWRNVIAKDTAPSKHYDTFPKIPAFDVGDKANQKCWTLGPTNKLKKSEQNMHTYIHSPVPVSSHAVATAHHKNVRNILKKQQCERLLQYPSDDAYDHILYQCPQNT